jgi:hypothetical protein
MPTPVGFDVESYFGEFAEASAMAEASRFRTIPTGSYLAQVTKVEGRYFEQKVSKNGGNYWAMVFSDDSVVDTKWRKGYQLTADVFNAEGKKLSNIRFEASWEAQRDAKGKLDQLFTRWSQLSKAMFPNLKDDERANKSTGEVVANLKQYPIKLRISESFKTQAIDGSTKWQTANNEEEGKTFREAGYEPKNFIQAVTKA